MVERFGAYFKNLTLFYVEGVLTESMSCACVEVIQCIARCCRYEILTLYACRQVDCAMCPTDQNLLALLTNEHLKSFTLFGVACLDMRVLLSNDKLSGCLEQLSLYGLGGVARWKVSSPREMLAVASQFTHLRTLYLDSPMLSDDLIVNLSDQGRAQLRELGIQMTCTFPYIKASSWIRLRAYSPCLQVYVKVIDQIPDDELFRFVIPEMEITSLSLIENAAGGDICTMCDRFSSIIEKFVDQSTDSEYIHRLKICSQLNVTLRHIPAYELVIKKK